MTVFPKWDHVPRFPVTTSFQILLILLLRKLCFGLKLQFALDQANVNFKYFIHTHTQTHACRYKVWNKIGYVVLCTWFLELGLYKLRIMVFIFGDMKLVVTIQKEGVGLGDSYWVKWSLYSMTVGVQILRAPVTPGTTACILSIPVLLWWDEN